MLIYLISSQKSYFCDNDAIYDVIMMQVSVRKWRHNKRHQINRENLLNYQSFILTHPFSFLDNRQGQFCRSWSYLFSYHLPPSPFHSSANLSNFVVHALNTRYFFPLSRIIPEIKKNKFKTVIFGSLSYTSFQLMLNFITIFFQMWK